MAACMICGAENFRLQDGFYFCDECGTQSQDIREEFCDIDDAHPGAGVQELKKKKSNTRTKKSVDRGLPWLTIEAYQCLLKAMVNSLISFGVDARLKDTVWSIWTHYLRGYGIAFTGKKEKEPFPWYRRPTLSQRDHDYGTSKDPHSKKKATKVKKEEIEDMELACIMDEEFYEGDDPMQEKSEDSDSSTGTQGSIDSLMTWSGKKAVRQETLVSVLYIALRWINEPITANDLTRWIREGHLEYHKAKEVLPSHMKFTGSDIVHLCGRRNLYPLKVANLAVKMALKLGMPPLPPPNMEVIKARLIIDLDLPDVFHDLVSALMILIKYKPKFNQALGQIFIPQSYYLDEMVATFIIIAMKLIYFLDDENEKFGRLRMMMSFCVADNIESFYSWAHRVFTKKKKRLSDGIPLNDFDLKYIEDFTNYSSFCASNVFTSWQPKDVVPKVFRKHHRHTKACQPDKQSIYHKFFATTLENSIGSANPALPLTSFPLTCLDTNRQEEFLENQNNSQRHLSTFEDSDLYPRNLQTMRKKEISESLNFLLGVCARRIEILQSDLQHFVNETETYIFEMFLKTPVRKETNTCS